MGPEALLIDTKSSLVDTTEDAFQKRHRSASPTTAMAASVQTWIAVVENGR